jgi:hypothetical protein
MQRWNITDHYRFDMDPDIPMYGQPVDSQKTMIVKLTVVDRRIQRVAYIPCWLNKKVQPEPLTTTDPRFDQHLDYMRWMVRNQRMTTTFTPDGNEVAVNL